MAEVKEVKSITKDVAYAASQGRKFTDARNALIAYGVLVVEVSQADMSRETGVDKGDVSRVVKQAKGNPEAIAALQALNRQGSQSQRIDAAAVIGEAYLRRVKRAAPVKGEAADGEAADSKALKSTPKGLVKGDESDAVWEAVAGLYPLALAMDDAGRDRLALVIADALRQAKIDARRIKAGKEPQGFEVPATTEEVAA